MYYCLVHFHGLVKRVLYLAANNILPVVALDFINFYEVLLRLHLILRCLLVHVYVHLIVVNILPVIVYYEVHSYHLRNGHLFVLFYQSVLKYTVYTDNHYYEHVSVHHLKPVVCYMSLVLVLYVNKFCRPNVGYEQYLYHLHIDRYLSKYIV